PLGNELRHPQLAGILCLVSRDPGGAISRATRQRGRAAPITAPVEETALENFAGYVHKAAHAVRLARAQLADIFSAVAQHQAAMTSHQAVLPVPFVAQSILLEIMAKPFGAALAQGAVKFGERGCRVVSRL